ncbi:MAG: FAD-dependent oxidoreductase [Mariprofundales bacterium]
MSKRIAIIGAGLTGLSCAVHLARSKQIDEIRIFEAAPNAGGRTRSFFDKQVNQWVDNGPHLLIGAYKQTQKLLRHIGVEHHLSWQPLALALWESQRGNMSLKPVFASPLMLPAALACLPNHNIRSSLAMIKLAIRMRLPIPATISVQDWCADLPEVLQRDLLEPLCLGVMNEAMQTANAASFSHVLGRAFANANTARLGWCNKPMQQAFIEPLRDYLQQHSIYITTNCRIQSLSFVKGIQLHTRSNDLSAYQADEVVLAIPALARNRLLGINQKIETRPICNVHLWLKNKITLPATMTGGIGTLGQWFFDVSQQWHNNANHYCAVISAASAMSKQKCIQQIVVELAAISGVDIDSIQLHHARVITEQHATTLIRPHVKPIMPLHVFDACEQPCTGDLPATIETAIERGRDAAIKILHDK